MPAFHAWVGLAVEMQPGFIQLLMTGIDQSLLRVQKTWEAMKNGRKLMLSVSCGKSKGDLWRCCEPPD